jgi:hypothetical protein
MMSVLHGPVDAVGERGGAVGVTGVLGAAVVLVLIMRMALGDGTSDVGAEARCE